MRINHTNPFETQRILWNYWIDFGRIRHCQKSEMIFNPCFWWYRLCNNSRHKIGTILSKYCSHQINWKQFDEMINFWAPNSKRKHVIDAIIDAVRWLKLKGLHPFSLFVLTCKDLFAVFFLLISPRPAHTLEIDKKWINISKMGIIKKDHGKRYLVFYGTISLYLKSFTTSIRWRNDVPKKIKWKTIYGCLTRFVFMKKYSMDCR